MTPDEREKLRADVARFSSLKADFERSADALSASFERLEGALRAGGFTTTAAVAMLRGDCRWAIYADKTGATAWRLLYCAPCEALTRDGPVVTVVAVPLLNAVLKIRIEAAAVMDDLLTALLVAEEEK